jgi:hypothetical protein
MCVRHDMRVGSHTKGKRKRVRKRRLTARAGDVPPVASSGALVGLLGEDGSDGDGDVVKVECAEEILQVSHKFISISQTNNHSHRNPP